jgi:hypothetical protein
MQEQHAWAVQQARGHADAAAHRVVGDSPAAPSFQPRGAFTPKLACLRGCRRCGGWTIEAASFPRVDHELRGEDGWRTEHEGGELDACLARAAAAEDQVRRLIVRFASPTPLTLALTRTRPLIGAGEDTGADVHGRARACGRPAGAARAQPLPRQHTGGAVQHPGGAALHTGGAVLRVASATPSPASAARTENEFVLALGERERLVGRND